MQVVTIREINGISLNAVLLILRMVARLLKASQKKSGFSLVHQLTNQNKACLPKFSNF